MTIELLTEHNLEFLSLKEDCTGLSQSTLVKMPWLINRGLALTVSDLLEIISLSYRKPKITKNKVTNNGCYGTVFGLQSMKL